MRKLFWVFAAVLCAVPAWADDLQPETLSQEVREYNSFWGSNDIDPTNHEVWKLYICGELIPNNNYNHEKEIFVTRFAPNAPYIVYLRINQIYNFLQPVPKVGDVIAVEGRVMNHFYSTVQGSVKRVRIPVVYFYVENASKLPYEPAAAAAILTPEPTPTVAVPSGTPVAAVSSPVPQTASAPVTPALGASTPGILVH